MNRSVETLKRNASFFARSLLMERFPVRISEMRPRVPNTYGQPKLPRNSTRFNILTLVVVARSRKMRRNCSPTEDRCCGARIIPACARPATTHFRVESIKVRDVEGVEHAPMFGGKGQLFVIRLLDETRVQNRDHRNTTRNAATRSLSIASS